MPKQPLASVALTVIGNEPVCVGVPERTPAVESVKPVGSVPLLSENVTVPTVLPAVKFWLKAAFTGPVGVAPFGIPTPRHPVSRLLVAQTPKQPLGSVA